MNVIALPVLANIESENLGLRKSSLDLFHTIKIIEQNVTST